MRLRSPYIFAILIILVAVAAGGGIWLWQKRLAYDAGQIIDRASALARSGNYRGALETLRRLPAGDLNQFEGDGAKISAEMFAVQGITLLNEQKYQEAINALEAALSRSPATDVKGELALAYGRIGETQKALDIVNDAIRRAPQTPRYYDIRGFLYASLGDAVRSKEDLRKVLELDPDYSSGAAVRALLNSL